MVWIPWVSPIGDVSLKKNTTSSLTQGTETHNLKWINTPNSVCVSLPWVSSIGDLSLKNNTTSPLTQETEAHVLKFYIQRLSLRIPTLRHCPKIEKISNITSRH